MSQSNPAMLTAIRHTLYTLKQRYGAEISVYQLASASTDYETGAKSATKTSIDIRKAPVLPAQEMRRFFASIAFITSSKAFVSPGQPGWDQSTRGFIIDARDMPGVELQPEDWIVYRNRRYEFEAIQRIEFDAGWLVVGKELKGSDPEEIINLNVVDTLDVEQETTES